MRTKAAYWEKSFERNEAEGIGFGRVFILSMVIIAVFLIVYVRHMCVREGYEISRLSGLLEEREIQYQLLVEKKTEDLDIDGMYKKAEELGLVMPNVEKTFYVQ
ncbi:hypothetical protein [Limisalsivibrio acetivorans]|uniref:hypothetical protein n=1 Tax=Limisalsivibrio acetivorans TaxID=1304888 RepID=UPI0003B5E840|nr:hypothetical protein [Limisalsivibrio acetivorans]